MRILLVSEDIPYLNMGGLAKHVLNLTRALIRAGHKVDILGGDQHPIEVAGEEGKFDGHFFGELNGHDIGWKEGKFGMYMPPRRSWVARRFARIILKHAPNYDVIHYHGHVPNVARYIPPGINFVQTRHDHGSDCLIDTRYRNNEICRSVAASNCASCKTANPNSLQKAVSTIAVNRFRKEVAEGFLQHKTIFVSNMLRQNFKRTMGEHHQWGTVIHNFADITGIEQARQTAKTLPPDAGIHVFVAGKIYPAKGIEPFLREVHNQLPANMRISVAGDGPDAARLRSEFEGEKIRFLGWCSPRDTLEMTAAATAVVVPSVWEEPFGSTTLEGLLLGKPTFALNYGATPELKMYASFPEQLRLHKDMQSLVKDLISFIPKEYPVGIAQDLACADHAAKQILDVYALPPGHNFD